MTQVTLQSGEPTIWQIVIGSVTAPRKTAELFQTIDGATRRAWQLLWLGCAVLIFLQTSIELLRDWDFLPTVEYITGGKKLFLNTPAMRLVVGSSVVLLLCVISFPVARRIWFYFCKDDKAKFGVIVGISLTYAFQALIGIPVSVMMTSFLNDADALVKVFRWLFLGGIFSLATYYITLTSGFSFWRSFFLNLVAAAGGFTVAMIFCVVYLIVVTPILRVILNA